MKKSETGLAAAIFKAVGLLDRSVRVQFVGILVLMVLSAILEMLNVGMLLPLVQIILKPEDPLTLQLIAHIKEFLPGTDMLSGFWFIAVALLAVFVIKNILIGIAVYLQSLFVAITQAKMTTRLLTSFAHKPYEDHLELNSANTVYDITNTAPAVVGGILQPSLAMVMEVLLVSGAAIALFAIAAKGATIAAVIVAVALMLFYFVVRHRLFDLGRRQRTVNSTISRWSHFCLGATKDNLILGRAGHFIDIISDLARESARITATIQVINQLPRIYGEVVIVLAMIVVCAVVVQDQGSIQEALPVLAVFMAAAFRVFPSANRIVHYAAAIRQSTALLDAVYEDLREAHEREIEPLPETPAVAVPFEHEIRLADASYRYPKTETFVIRDVSLTINKGETIAIVGPTGAGKSTLVDIILGLLPLTEGELLIDGVPVLTGTSVWQGRVGYVPQSIYLLDDSLRRNIALGLPDEEIDDQRLAEVLRFSRLDDVVDSMDNGLDTMIGERGVRMSGGQRQRVGIARALYHDPELMVLDEATSSLDSETEHEVTSAVRGLQGTRTMIVIAHRLSTVRHCDQIFFIKDGTLDQAGTFDELMSNSTAFRRMVELSRVDQDAKNIAPSVGHFVSNE